MKIHEYQAKKLFSSYGIPVEQHVLCCNADEVLVAYENLNREKAMLKAQVLTGGRGKAGGVKLVNNTNDVHVIYIDADMCSNKLKQIGISEIIKKYKDRFVYSNIKKGKMINTRFQLGYVGSVNMGISKRNSMYPINRSTRNPFR